MDPRRPVIVGEVLFDCFADEMTLGGAPFNVAWHLRGFGLDPLLVSRVGEDALGARVREAMDRWGMDPAGLQRDAAHPTGQVQVTLRDGQPEYAIVPDQAYDHIDWQAAAAALPASAGLLYHGSLALRRPAAAGGLRELRRACRLPAFVDVNLRTPWWSRSEVGALLDGARWVKLNHAELADLAAEGENAAAFAARHGLEALVVTRGEAGASAYVAPACYEVPGAPVKAMADAVGAGDAFSAVAVMGLLRGWSWPEILSRAAGFAARVCGYRGAIREDRDLYERCLEEWPSAG